MQVMQAIRKKSLVETVRESWWVFLFLGITSGFYFYGMHEKTLAYRELERRHAELEREKALALEHQEELLLQINSQSDPQWIEMILKKDLGVVSEGQVKVYFEKTE